MKQATRIVALIALITFQLTWVSSAAPQQYPTRPITLIVPFAPGGPVDTLARPVASSMAKSLKQALIIDNIGGASGNIGVARAAKAAPDGYTVLIHHIDVYLALVDIPAIGFFQYGRFMGVHLAVGGQQHQALLGRTLLDGMVMIYDGAKGSVTLAR